MVSHSMNMIRLIHALVGFSLVVIFASSTVAGPVEDASEVIDRWAEAITANDINAVVKLYTPDALLHGISSPKLYAGSESIREYFKTSPEIANKVTITERHMIILAEAAVMGIGFYQFDLFQEGIRAPRMARFTFVMVKRGNDWLITHHHSSMLPPAPLQ